MSDHDLIELFAKRNFRCDCGTPSLYRLLPSGVPAQYPPCTIRKPGYDVENDQNKYNHNFEGHYCICKQGHEYDANKEDANMFQCLRCEDWFHDKCTSLVPKKRKIRRGGSPTPAATKSSTEKSDADGQTATISEEAQEKGNPAEEEDNQPLIDSEFFDHFVCSACVAQEPILQHYLGARGFVALLPSDLIDASAATAGDGHDGIATIWADQGRYAFVGLRSELVHVPEYSNVNSSSPIRPKRDLGAETTRTSPPVQLASSPSSAARGKRKATDEDENSADPSATSKRARVEHEANEEAEDGDKTLDATSPKPDPTCRLPVAFPLASDWRERLANDSARLDLFLGDQFRSRVCPCTTCAPKWSHLPFLLEDEVTYSPPHSSAGDDPSDGISEIGSGSNASTYDLGVAALQRLPREKILSTMGAYQRFRDELFAHLRPNAQSGEVVTEANIREFFAKRSGAQ